MFAVPVTEFTPGAMQDITVLLVDDDTFAREQVAHILRRVVGNVITAENGHEGLELFRDEAPDILLVDILMPGMDGLEFSSRVRKLDADVPIFIATGVDEPELLIKALECDVDQLLLKPVLPDALLAAIQKTVRRIYMRRKLIDTENSLRMLMDTYPNYVIMVDGGEVAYVNKTMLARLGYESFESFRSEGRPLGDYFSEFNGESYDGGNGWLDVIINDPLDREHMVRIPDPRVKTRRACSYVVGHREFPTPGKYLFTLTDVSELEDRSRTLENQASTDPLTGVANRRSFLDLVAQASVGGQDMCLVMFDIDHFKRVNDDFGHDVGDVVLKDVARLVQDNVRSTDVVARWGGEEFMVLTPSSDINRAKRVAERLRRKIEGYDFPGVNRVVSSSFGVTQRNEDEVIDEFIKRVDEALYKAKEGGRNRVVVG